MPAASAKPPELWPLVLESVHIDPEDLLAAVEEQIARPHPDFRTRVLLRDSLVVLQNRWGNQGLMQRLSSNAADRFAELLTEDLGERGFSSLEQRVVEQTLPVNIERFLRELGLSLQTSCKLMIGGSCALILPGLLHRRTDDINAVNEVPEILRTQHELIENLVARYGLRLTHFQSHYLPDHWELRVQSFADFGQLHVFLIDPIDILVGKLFSRREKDLDDLRATLPGIGRGKLKERLLSSGASLMSNDPARQNATRNWYILFGENLPTG